MTRIATVLALGAVLSVLAPLPSLAHGDVRLVDDSFVVTPGTEAVFEGSLHYHRLVGRVVADRPVSLQLVDADTGAVVVSAGPDRVVTVNRLVECCDGTAWAPHRLVIANAGSEPARVEATVTLVHDDVAVMVYRAESGTAESVVILGGIWWWAVRRLRRREVPGSRARAIAMTTGLMGAVAAVVAVGAARYGGLGPEALVAGLADVPVLPINSVVARASLLLGVTMIGWALAGGSWVRARSAMTDAGWIGLGIVLVGAVVVTAVSIGMTYRAAGMPLAMAAVAIVPLLLVLVGDRRSQTETTP